ncbi:MAG: hypothetical protein A3K19_14340 [Lentisphaerae bacterium RIFOXYB12_FULL_65_16]|nr:MAG: hypothetical protein A3K18_18385 [Lentisphaerae bacterium RIFOXYA12_64_32]OGV87402.1 MAG: hypothetical protein A3K19_14340 [Lentisphaerae bacterium RIFOXYB12_FULL_65_16]
MPRKRTPPKTFPIPPDILQEPDAIPAFWLSTVDEVNRYLDTNLRKGTVARIGTSAGGRPINAACYGTARQGVGTTTFSGSLGFGNVRAYRGPDSDKTVYVALGAVHGGEVEGVMSLVNLLAVLETGSDLRGKPWPDLTAAAARLDRIIVVPIVNVDGRARIPLRMFPYRDQDDHVHKYLNTGVWSDGSHIGWPTCKEFIPLDFARTQFPGGYPNDAGVNFQHDDFLGARQPETQALLDLVARERPDLILNLHTGAPPRDYYIRMHRPLAEPALTPTFEALYRHVHTTLALAGCQSTNDPAVEADPTRPALSHFNLDTALNLHCGALSTVVEFPSHGFAGTRRDGTVVRQTPEMILDAGLVLQQAAMQFLADTGGRQRWTPGRGEKM